MNHIDTYTSFDVLTTIASSHQELEQGVFEAPTIAEYHLDYRGTCLLVPANFFCAQGILVSHGLSDIEQC
jgi:hypothetical protein